MYGVDRRTFIYMVVGAAVAGKAVAQSLPADAPLGFIPDPNFVAQAKKLLAAKPALDLHAHPGVTFMRDALSPEVQHIVGPGPFESLRIADMVAGGMAGSSFAAVADVEILGLRKGALGWTREFRPGEARASYERQIANLNEWVRKAGATIALAPDDIVRLHSRKKIAALLTVEGGDFLAGDARYVRRAFTDGVRSITLVHYHPNDIGDNQTAEPQSGGLTAFGREVVAEMDQVGMVIDVAHASEDTVRGVLKTTRNPVMCSHTLLAGHGPQNPRFISDALALEIAAQGGVIGAWPSGFGSATMNDYIDHILTLSRVVGPEHVGFGTDMDGNYKPVFNNYRQMPLLVSELLRRDYGAENTAAFLGGNFLRVFGKVWSGRSG
jgi:membrane dipeptidase